ncbi:MAG: hypothetical protein ACYCY5_03110 [Sulfuricella sp.]
MRNKCKIYRQYFGLERIVAFADYEFADYEFADYEFADYEFADYEIVHKSCHITLI